MGTITSSKQMAISKKAKRRVEPLHQILQRRIPSFLPNSEIVTQFYFFSHMKEPPTFKKMSISSVTKAHLARFFLLIPPDAIIYPLKKSKYFRQRWGTGRRNKENLKVRIVKNQHLKKITGE